MGSVARRPAPGTAGFTLLELLLVLVILSVMYSLAALSLVDSARARLDSEASRLQYVLRGLRREALLQRSPAGLQVDEQGYQGLLFDSLGRQWIADPRRWLRRRELAASDLVLTVSSESESASPTLADSELPAVVFDSSGVSEPFSLRLATSEPGGPELNMVADGVGGLRLQ